MMSDTTMVDLNCISYWYPRLAHAGLPCPTTIIVRSADTACLFDGEEPEGWDRFIRELTNACAAVGWPAFLRTGHGSGKHSWRRTCFVPNALNLENHVAALTEWSLTAGIMGLPRGVWAAREMLATEPMFICAGYGGMPVVREFRFFVRDGDVEHVQPYWPPGAAEQGHPTIDEAMWRTILASESELRGNELSKLAQLARAACAALGGGFWSVDMLEDRDGKWWVTDVADGDQSFMWDPCDEPPGENLPA